MIDKKPLAGTARRDLILIGLLGVVLLGVMMPILGVWEPWEAQTATLIETMRETGAWMKLQLPNGDGFDVIPDLPFRVWPAVATTALFGMSELGLRLPGLLLALPVLLLLFSLTRRLYGRQAAWLASLTLLTMPLFGYHSRFALGGAEIVGLTALSSLAFLRVILVDERVGLWRWIAWLTLAGAGLTGGAPALLVPLTIAGVALLRGAPLERLLDKRAAGIAAALVALGYWRAASYLPEDHSLQALFLWADGLNDAVIGKDRPSFEAFVHQIGFGLFPLGGLLPLAFAELLWDEDQAHPMLMPLAAGFAVAFIAPAIGMSYSHYALFLGAPLVALIVGVYLHRVVQGEPRPLLVFTAVVIIALLDSNLKHETHALADTLVSQRVDAFPPKLDGWWVARILNMGLLALLIIHQGAFHRFFTPITRAVVYPSRRAGWLNGFFLIPGVIPGGLLFRYRPDWFMSVMGNRTLWGPLLPETRSVIVFIALALITFLLLRGLWNLRVTLLRGRRDGIFTLWSDQLAERARDRGAILASLTTVLIVMGLFMNVWVARTLTQNFSQRDILNEYHASKVADEPIFRYRIPPKTRSFYTRQLEELDAKAFKERSSQEDRFYAIIPRDKLARINTEFRNASKRTLPVLDDSSYRYLLVSNQLKEGEVDKSPIKRALVDQLPEGVNPIKINFEDKIELVGWRVEPKRPRPGSEMTISLYWKPLKKLSNNWKVFVHIDAPGQRIHGDHDPVEGLYPTRDWKPGDIVQDVYRKVVKSSITPAVFTFYTGLYKGSRRMKIKAGPKDNDNRAKLGRVRVR